MNNNIKKFYQALNKLNIFKDMSQCQSCNASCNAPMCMSWLLSEEVKIFKNKYKLGIQRIGKANFFKDGPCKFYKPNIGCTIYNERPLECRLNPMLFLKIDNELWWILTMACPIVNKASKAQLTVIKKTARSYIGKFEHLITPEIRLEINNICEAINIMRQFTEGADFIKIAKI